MIANSDLLLGAVIFVLAVACVVGLRLTTPPTITRPAWDWDPEPRHVVSVTRPLALAEEPVPVCVPVVHIDDTIDLTPNVLSFLEGL